MSNVIVVREQDARVACFERAEIRILATAEVDVYRDTGPEPMPFEIRVRMARPEKGGLDRLLSYESIAIHPSIPGDKIRILGEDGRYLDREMEEVLVWEAIEYDEAALTYIYGREPARVAQGQLARIGDVVHLAEVASEPDLAM